MASAMRVGMPYLLKSYCSISFLMRFVELRDLVISWLTISLAFGLIYSRVDQMPILDAFLISSLAVGTGFILHELAHKYVAIHYGAHAEFRMWPAGLVIALALAFVAGIVFAAPGAVYVMGNVSTKKNAIISIAGPITNVILAGLFVLLTVIASDPILKIAFLLATQVNLWLALFNMIPLPPLDGSKVFTWNPLVWAALFVPLVAVVFLL